MGVLSNLPNLFVGLAQVFGFFRDFFGCLPIICQLLVYFAFGGFMLIFLVQMLRSK